MAIKNRELLEDAILTHDKRFLSTMGHKGAQARRLKKDRLQTRLQKELEERAEQANEHICPVDD